MKKIFLYVFLTLLNIGVANASNCDGDIYTAWDLYDKKQYSRAITLLNCNGTPEANALLGYMYEHGEGVNVDYKKASEFYYLAADAGRSDAQNNLGALYEGGLLGKSDYDKAFKYYSMSSEQGYSKAKENLGRFYLKGYGTERDAQKGIGLLKEASKLGEHRSNYLLAMVYSSNDYGVKNLNSAKEWATLAKNNGIKEADSLLVVIKNKKEQREALNSYRTYQDNAKNTQTPSLNLDDDFSDYEKILSMTCIGHGGTVSFSWDGERLRDNNLISATVDGDALKKKKGENVFILTGFGLIDFDRKRVIIKFNKQEIRCF